METSVDKEKLVELLADRARFTKGDAKVFLDTLIEIFEEAVRDGTEINVRGFGKLHVQPIRARRGYNKITKQMVEFPATTRAIFKLAQTIRFADKYKE